jgi:hypothetical protein
VPQLALSVVGSTQLPLHRVPDEQDVPPPVEGLFPEPAPLVVFPEPPALVLFPAPPLLVVFPAPALLVPSPEPPLTPVLPARVPASGDENDPHEAIVAPSDTTKDSGISGRIFFICDISGYKGHSIRPPLSMPCTVREEPQTGRKKMLERAMSVKTRCRLTSERSLSSH